MNALQKTFLSMIKTVLWSEPFKAEEGITPGELFAEACRHEIAGVLSCKLDLFCGDDIDTRAKWSKKAMAVYRKSSYVLSAQASLCSILAKDGIKPVILKGLASAYYYPAPLLREFNDIDFLVPPSQFETCCSLLEQNGYTRGHDGMRHIEYAKQGIEYEVHRYFSSDISAADHIIDRTLYEGCENCVSRTVEGKTFYAFPEDVHGIVLLEHLRHHFIDGVGFRQIMDWVVYAGAYLNDDAWNHGFLELVQKCGLERFAKSITRMAQLYLGLDDEKISWCREIDDALCAEVIEHVFLCDNFGISKETNKETHIVGNIIRRGFFEDLNKKAMARIPSAKKIVILRPVAWTCQIMRWGVAGFEGFILKKNRSDWSVKEWKRQQKLFKDLGV